MNNDEDGGLGNLPHNQDGDGGDDDDDDDDDVIKHKDGGSLVNLPCNQGASEEVVRHKETSTR